MQIAIKQLCYYQFKHLLSLISSCSVKHLCAILTLKKVWVLDIHNLSLELMVYLYHIKLKQKNLDQQMLWLLWASP
jgi:hypothetical protein